MPSYRFQITDTQGNRQTGERAAESAEDLLMDLQAEGLEVHSIVPLSTDDRPATEAAPAGRDRLSSDEARLFAEQLAGLTRAGLPLHSGLRALAEELTEGALRRTLISLADRLEAGEPLDDALAGLGNRLPSHLRSLVMAGARSGRVGPVLGEFVNYAQIGASLRRALWLGLAYPIMLIGALLLLYVYLAMIVSRGFEDIFKDFNIALPTVTVALLKTAHALTEKGLVLVTGPIVVLVLGWLASRLLLDEASRHRLFNLLPLLGPLWRWTALAEFSHYLALLVECEIPLPMAVPLAAEGTRDAELRRASKVVGQEIAEGMSLGRSVSWWHVFPFGFGKLLRWAEGHQSLPETLHMAGEVYEARARSQASFVASVFAVSAVIFVIWSVGFIVVALFLPLIQLISRLSG